MENQEEKSAIHEGDILTFLSHHGFSVENVAPYVSGIASLNFRASRQDGLDLTVRCDLRRSIEKVQEDRKYSACASQQGITVPEGPWYDGHIKGNATTARPTIIGTSLIELSKSQLPSPRKIGDLLGTLHKARPPLGQRNFFYAALFDRSDPLWENFKKPWSVFRTDSEIRPLMEAAFQRLERHAPKLCSFMQLPQCIIHGDFNPPNILKSGDEIILIDWEKACTGFPVADVIQAVYYFSAHYGQYSMSFADEFLVAYLQYQRLEPNVLEAWFHCFPAFIFLRDTISSSLQPPSSVGRMQLARFQAYLRQDSAPRFKYFLENEENIKRAIS